MEVSIISIGILLGLFFSFDLCLMEKNKGAFVRYLLYMFTVTSPAVYNSIVSTKPLDISSFAYYWLKFFYPSFFVAIIIFSFFSYFFLFKKLQKRVNCLNLHIIITVLDFLYDGYKKFKENLEKIMAEEKEERKTIEEGVLNLSHNLEDDIVNFVATIYETVEHNDIAGYVGYVLLDFINRFLGQTDARFTLRQLNLDKNVMEAKLTSRHDKVPGDIKLNEDNLIVESLQQGRPVLFSEKKGKHQRTKNDSLNNIYDEYVSNCLVVTEDGRPYISISLDVKGENSVNRLRAFVNSAIFSIICEALSRNILSKLYDINEEI